MPVTLPESGLSDPRYSRRDLVIAIANKDGGTHVDRRGVEYDEFTRDFFTMEVANKTSEVEGDFMPVQGNPAEVALRQIGHEVLMTLDEQAVRAALLR
jgi:hypothetical protein